MIQLATAIVPPPSSVHTRVFYLHWWNICICPLLRLCYPQSGIPQHSPPHSYQHISSVKITNLCVCNVAAEWQSDDETNIRVRCIKWPVIISPGSTDTGECYNCYNMLVIQIEFITLGEPKKVSEMNKTLLSHFRDIFLWFKNIQNTEILVWQMSHFCKRLSMLSEVRPWVELAQNGPSH